MVYRKNPNGARDKKTPIEWIKSEMYGQFAKKRYYRCVARDWDKQCPQSLAPADLIEEVQKRTQFQQELEGRQPLPRAMLEESLRVFRDFRKMREEGDLYQRKHLLGRVVEKV